MEDKFSVLMSVYKNDKPEDLKAAIESIYSQQELKPNEIILIVDGPVPENLKDKIGQLERDIECLTVFRLKENEGLGNALRIGVGLCTNEIIARMDSDDLAVSSRFKSQIDFLQKNPQVDIVGGQIEEFIDTPDNIVAERNVPIQHHDIVSYMRKRCPFNHMTVMFRKSAVMKAGNYIPWHFNEDYYLWIRMFMAGATFANLPSTIVNVRVGKEMYARRGGSKYFKSEKDLQGYMYQQGIIKLPQYIFNVMVRFVIQVAMPNSMRKFVFQNILRK